MSVKILGGLLKSYLLDVPKGDVVRPTSIILKRKLFDSHQEWESFVMVDLCAGSGSVGFESWSRGADKVYLVESNKKVLEILKKNKNKIAQNYSDELSIRSIEIINSKAESWINTFMSEYDGWDDERKSRTVIFLDPPYKLHSLYFKVLETLKDNFLGTLWIESDRLSGISEKDASRYFNITKTYKHSDSFLLKVHFG